ncbi:MAG TPA: Shedu immune nuclease family protein [Verrucomicrobiae bacterium]|nr:Shedu immune nuclease family protein [Verrucomicrobiae bacterium]
MSKLKYCEISNKSYGQKWQKFKLYYAGTRPKLIRDDGAFSSGKSLLEALATKFRDFELVLTPEESRIQKNSSARQVFLAIPKLQKMNARLFTQKKHVTQRAVSHLLSDLFPRHFAAGNGVSRPARRLNSSKLKVRFNLRKLQQLAEDFQKRIETDNSESTWQKYLKQNILHIQPGYIELIPKASVKVSGASFPDFFLITYDGYLDILEIKTPFTPLLSHDKNRGKHVWSPEIAKAIAEVENHLQAVSHFGDDLRNKVKDGYGIELPVVKPRGIVFAGNSAQFKDNKSMQDDFALLSQALTNVSLVTYDELLTRLRNHITVLSGTKGKKE